ncbi:YrrS family protein [Halobacillus sp. A5]|uniref:YrrS family protein n=1 Tax=Halobacillus sp. A5 TaxID=2880263 RepID=UPI0020A6668E|nr:YrrS family protein [Halobacillus sp. A5]MCP3025595.1 YrrS family protein [Halobacillus sp. A5]
MKNDQKLSSRSNRFEKRNRTKKLMTILAAAAVLLVMVYIGLFTFTGGTGPESDETATESANEEENNKNEEENSGEEESDKDLEVKENEDEESSEDEDNSEDEESEEDSEDEENSKDEEESSEEEDNDRQVEESSDENVDRVITEDWEPVATEQDTSGDHTTSFNQGSQDWEEIISAATMATGLNSGDIIEWRVENAGDGQVHAVISNQSQDPVYRVLIEWVDGEGYRPLQVEELNGNPYE